MAILQAGSVRTLMDEFHAAVPELRVQYYVDKANVLHIQIPNTFDDLPEMTKIHATVEMVRLQEALIALGVQVEAEVYEARNARA